VKRTFFAAILAAATALVPAIASAETFDVSAGYLGAQDGNGEGAAILTYQGPRFGPFGTQLSGMFPFTGGGAYAATAEGVFHVPGGAYIGAGLGVGRMSAPFDPGMLYDIVAGVPIFPHIDLVGRYYARTSGHEGGQGVFGGLQLKL
jgi:hypothetical protein